MSDTQIDEVFLATTALENFWDVSKPVVFLGEWCRLYERITYLEELNGRLLGGPYDHADVAEEAYLHVKRIYEQILPVLGEKLNSIHGRNYSIRYWRILLGPWMQLYLSAVYDRFLRITHAIDQYPGFTTIGLSSESFVVPTDTLDFACFLSEDSYNLQLYTKILRALGKEFPCQEAEVPRNHLYSKLLSNSWWRRAIGTSVKTYTNISAKLFKAVFLKNSHFQRKIELQFLFREFGQILYSWNQMVPCHRFEYDSEKRNALRVIELGEGEFGRCLSTMLYVDMPQCFVEGFRVVGDVASKNYPKHSNAIFSANGWYYDEPFKQWAAMLVDKGAVLAGTQHGGIYGGLKYMPSEDYETSIVDHYYSWGWERADCTAKVIPMPATKLIGRNKIGADNNKKGILWVATSSPRYVVQLPFLPEHFREYLAWQIKFAAALPQKMLAETCFRPHYENYKWGTVERLKDCFPSIRVESWAVPFQVSLENCRLYVCDHLSTTFAEALAANKPTVLFCNPRTNRLRLEAQPFFDLLKDGGILFDSPEAAASAVAAVYEDVETWWDAPERQKTIRAFCERFARTSPDAIALWSKELKRISDLPSH